MKIRVLQYICPTGFYGAERWILALAKNLDPSKVLCHLAVTQESDKQELEVVERYTAMGLPVHVIRLRNRFDLRLLTKLKHIVSSQHIDIIHTHGYKPDITGLVVSRLTGNRCISTPHGFENVKDLKLQTYIRLGCMSLRFFDCVAPLSVPLQQEMKRIGVPEDKTELILNGVDLAELTCHLMASSSPERPEQKIVGYVGQLSPRKNVIDLIHSFDKVYRDKKKVALWLIGEGPQREWLESQASKLASGRKIRFWGYRADRLQLMRQCNVICMTSTLEGIPRALLESMALGVPVLAYDIPGVSDLITHQQTGFLAPMGKVKTFAQYLRAILFDPDFQNGASERARQYVHERFSAERMARDYEKVYERLLTGE